MAPRNKLKSSYYEDDVIYWFTCKSHSCYEVHKKLVEEKDYQISYPTVKNYYKNILPTIPKEKIEGIRARFELKRGEKEQLYISRLSEMDTSIDLLAKMQENLDITNENKLQHMANKEGLEKQIETTEKQIADIEKKIEKKELEKDTDLSCYYELIDKNKKEIEKNTKKVMYFIDVTTKLVRTMQAIRLDINKVLGDTWQNMVKNVIDDIIEGLFDVVNPSIKDEDREELKTKIKSYIHKMYEKYSIVVER